jgi:hypothetical protein
MCAHHRRGKARPAPNGHRAPRKTEGPFLFGAMRPMKSYRLGEWWSLRCIPRPTFYYLERRGTAPKTYLSRGTCDVVVKPAVSRFSGNFATNTASAGKPISWSRLLLPLCQRTQKKKRESGADAYVIRQQAKSRENSDARKIPGRKCVSNIPDRNRVNCDSVYCDNRVGRVDLQ